jgi:uncharacterized protein (DUF1697 family)
MKTCIALLRGINVGGSNVLPMGDLVAILEDTGAQYVKTYIQSGNAVFLIGEANTRLLSDRIRTEIGKRHGFEPHVLILELEALERAVDANPFPEAESEPKTLHLLFLAGPAEDPDLDALEAVRGDRERFSLGDSVFYLHAPDGIGRSRLAQRAERLLGVPATARNWRTVLKVLDLAKQCGPGA